MQLYETVGGSVDLAAIRRGLQSFALRRKYLLAAALITATAGTAMAQAPERCKNLQVLRSEWDQNPFNGNVTFIVYIRNDDPSRLIYATFAFEFLMDEDVKVGESQAQVGGLGVGQTYRVPIYTNIRDFKSFTSRPISCSFER
jgi:hypothetical protein